MAVDTDMFWAEAVLPEPLNHHFESAHFEGLRPERPEVI